jgi:4'-phosphopantetheinyl transferase
MTAPDLSPLWETGPERPELPAADLHLWRAPLDVSPETLAQLAALLSADESERAARYRVPHARQQFIVARGVLRMLLARYLGAPPETFVFHYNPYGKPALPAPLTFNMAHSHRLALYAFTRGADVGVDVEYLPRQVDMALIAPRLLTADESAALAALPVAQRYARFLRYWTRKEAVAKAQGAGLSRVVQPFDVSADSVTLPGDAGATEWQVTSFIPAADYVAAVACPPGEWRMQWFSADDAIHS